MGALSVEEIVYSAHQAMLQSEDAPKYIIELEKILNGNKDEGLFNDIMRFYKRKKERVISVNNMGMGYFKKAFNTRIASNLVFMLGIIGCFLFGKEIEPYFAEIFTVGVFSILALRHNSDFNLKTAQQEYQNTRTAVNWILSREQDVKYSLHHMKSRLEEDIEKYRISHYGSR